VVMPVVTRADIHVTILPLPCATANIYPASVYDDRVA
jgi:hypothetical protein